jgi:hypothetical protein
MISDVGSGAGWEHGAGQGASPGAGGVIIRPWLFQRLGGPARVTIVSAPRWLRRGWSLLGLFRRAQDLIGDKGIVDVTALMGWFTTVSLTLMAYDVPSNATGLDQ